MVCYALVGCAIVYAAPRHAAVRCMRTRGGCLCNPSFSMIISVSLLFSGVSGHSRSGTLLRRKLCEDFMHCCFIYGVVAVFVVRDHCDG